MTAAVWDPVTKKYFVGKSGHLVGNGNGYVPPAMWKTIAEEAVDVEDDAFGTNCAEVHCLLKAFEQRAVELRVLSLRDMGVFTAYKPGEMVPRGPCKSCKNWIKKYGATYTF